MKATGFIELVVIMSALIVGLPLFILTCSSANNMTTTYIHDKSTWNIATDIEYQMNDKGVLVPVTHITPQRLTLAQAAVLPYVQDEYSPDCGRNVDYNFDADDILDNTAPNYAYRIPPHSRGYRFANEGVIDAVAPLNKISQIKDKNYFYVYNPVRDTWMITNEFINVFGY